MKSLFRSIDYRSGTIGQIEEDITLEGPLSKYMGILTQDLLQVHYRDGKYVLDVGWNGDTFAVDEGEFIVKVVADQKWRFPPLYERRTAVLVELRSYIEEAVNFIENALLTEKE